LESDKIRSGDEVLKNNREAEEVENALLKKLKPCK
jgi:hypothetical protein